jgi:hypothetical protein
MFSRGKGASFSGTYLQKARAQMFLRNETKIRLRYQFVKKKNSFYHNRFNHHDQGGI